jgi:hypothetical protein
MGSVAEAVVRRAACPVLTLRPGAAKQVQGAGRDEGFATPETSGQPSGPARMHESRVPADAERIGETQQYLA